MSVTALLAGLVTVASPAVAQDGLVAHLDMDYVRQVIENLTAIGSTEQGFRAFGTPQDLASAEYVADEMTALGLDDVALEPVPGDGWLFEGASVTVGTKTLPAGAFAGVEGTGPAGVSGRLVFAGIGASRDYERLGVDVTGKIVLAWWNDEYDWPNHMAYEAKLRGADALII
ncbi:MAG TPA: hypothetical protein VFZ96_06410, partial [Actinomycetota bacterium]|nr:hypothetical protein [Actinomycetota bacterium]